MSAHAFPIGGAEDGSSVLNLNQATLQSRRKCKSSRGSSQPFRSKSYPSFSFPIFFFFFNCLLSASAEVANFHSFANWLDRTQRRPAGPEDQTAEIALKPIINKGHSSSQPVRSGTACACLRLLHQQSTGCRPVPKPKKKKQLTNKKKRKIKPRLAPAVCYLSPSFVSSA